jgi:hypothetical protein
MQATFQIDLDNVNEVRELKELLERRLWQIQNQQTGVNEVLPSIESGSKSANEQLEDLGEDDNINTIRKFIMEASGKQLQVLKWMKKNPGSVSAHILKNELPFLAPQGTIAGVFRDGRWKKLAGGSVEGFPLHRIGWDHEQGCGIYRGLTEEEADVLNF